MEQSAWRTLVPCPCALHYRKCHGQEGKEHANLLITDVLLCLTRTRPPFCIISTRPGKYIRNHWYPSAVWRTTLLSTKPADTLAPLDPWTGICRLSNYYVFIPFICSIVLRLCLHPYDIQWSSPTLLSLTYTSGDNDGSTVTEDLFCN